MLLNGLPAVANWIHMLMNNLDGIIIWNHLRCFSLFTGIWFHCVKVISIQAFMLNRTCKFISSDQNPRCPTFSMKYTGLKKEEDNNISLYKRHKGSFIFTEGEQYSRMWLAFSLIVSPRTDILITKLNFPALISKRYFSYKTSHSRYPQPTLCH